MAVDAMGGRPILLATVVVLACLSQAEAQRRMPAPQNIQGRWCMTDAANFSRPNMSEWEITHDKCIAEDKTLTITKYKIEWVESGCDVTKVETFKNSNGWEDYKLNLKCGGEGDTWNSVMTFSPNRGKTLVIELNSESNRRRVKFRE